MPIEFHCEHCGKLVRAADQHAGKRGQCPICHQSVYIPTPSDRIEPLTLAPVEEAEDQRQQLLKETEDLTRSLLSDREVPPDTPRPRTKAPVGDARLAKFDMEKRLIEYAQSMAAGDLNRAERLARGIRSDLAVAEELIQRLMADEILPPELADIPRPVLNGFFRQLREKR